MNPIIAIDPGPEFSAVVFWDGNTIHGFEKFKNTEYKRIIAPAGGYDCYIEMPACYGMPVGADIFETCVWVGRFMEINFEHAIASHRVFRRDIKLHLCGSARAKDSNVVAAIVDRFDPMRKHGKYGKGKKGSEGPFYGFAKDVWQAFAVALYAFDNRGN